MGLALTRSLGFQVIGRLARRIGVAVEVRHSEGGGTTAIIWVPADVLSAMGPSNAPVPEAFRPQPTTQIANDPTAPGPTEEFDWAPPVTHAPEAGIPVVRAEPEQLPAPQPAPTFQQEQAPAPPPASAPSFAPEAAPVASAHDSGELSPEELTDFFGEQPAAAPAAEFAPSPWEQPQPQPQPQQFEQPQPQPQPQQFEQPQPQPQPQPQSFEQPFQPASTAPLQQPAHDQGGWHQPASPDHTQPAQQLEQAVPTGAAFESGVDALLDDPNRRTGAGLVKRDRSQSSAPASEGRVIGEQVAAASVRSPDEIRSMLAQYREGLKGRPGGDPGNPIQEQTR